jgi:MFS family permease
MKRVSKYRWFVVGIFFFFMLLHQADKLLIGPLTTPIMKEFNINETQMGLLSTGAIIVEAIFYPLWGYLCDRFSRAKLLSAAAFIWGASTWLSAIAPTYSTFLVTRSSTGIDDSSYPGLYSLIADYFPPKARGKVYGLLQIAMPMGYLIGMVMALVLGGVIGWRSIFYITGSLGILMAIVIFFGVKEPERGTSEPELENIEISGKYHFDWKIARDLFKKRSLLLLFLQGFVGVFPWQVITFWFFRYLETERGFTSNEVLITMVIAILMMSAGYPLGGALGDWLFGKTKRGRVIVSATGVILGAGMLFLAIHVPYSNQVLFTVLMGFTALLMPFASPNVLSTVYDITLPEVRSTANSIQYFIEQGGSAVAPTLAGVIAMQSSLENSILYICVAAWVLCFIFFLGVIYLLPKDIDTLRGQMAERAQAEKRLQSAGAGD